MCEGLARALASLSNQGGQAQPRCHGSLAARGGDSGEQRFRRISLGSTLVRHEYRFAQPAKERLAARSLSATTRTRRLRGKLIEVLIEIAEGAEFHALASINLLHAFLNRGP